MSGPWTSHQNSMLLSSKWEFFCTKFSPHKKTLNQSSEDSLFVCLVWFVLFLCTVVVLWNLRPLGWWEFYHHFSCTKSPCLWVYTPTSPSYVRPLSRCGSSHSSTKQVSQQLSPRTRPCRPAGGAGEFEFLTTHCVLSHGRMRKDWSQNMAPLGWDHQNPTTAILHVCSHFWRKPSKEESAPRTPTHPHSTGNSERKTWHDCPVAAGSPGQSPCAAGPRPLAGRSEGFLCLANGAGIKTKQNKMLTCWVMTNWDTCHKGQNDSFASAVIIKTEQINHQYGSVCSTKQLYCIVNWRPRTYFRSVKPEKLKISPKLPLIDILPILLVLFFNQLKA